MTLDKSGLHATASGPPNDGTPPDTTGAAGPSAYVEFVNSQVGVYNKSTGSRTAATSEDTFTASTATCDGQIKWDQSSSRFLYYSLDCGAAPGQEGFSFGWSKTSSPTPMPSSSSAGNWCRFHASTGSTLEDYGKLGNNDNDLIIGSNEFNDLTGNYSDSPIIDFPKPPNGSTVCPSSEPGQIFTPPAGSDFTPEPVNLFGNSLPTGYVVGIDSSVSNALHLYSVAGTAASPTVSDLGDITVPTFAVPANVPQPASAPSSDVIDSSDARLTQASGAFDPAINSIGIWTQHTIAGANGGPSVVRWYELEPGLTTPVQYGTISVPGEFAFNGAISPTTAGNAAAVDYNVGGSNLLVQIRARFHPAGSAAGSMTSQVTLGRSAASDVDFSCPAATGGTRPCRWGDYAGATFDPGNSATVWGASQTDGPQVSGGGPQWRTSFFELTP